MERAKRIDKELDSLWERLEDLKRLDSKLGNPKNTIRTRTVEQIKDEITDRLGFFPPYFAPALDSPSLLENLWQQQLFFYEEDFLPPLFKEKLAIRLSRDCASAYFIVTHACTLYQLGIPAGEIKQLVEIPVLSEINVEQMCELLDKVPHPIQNWPAGDTSFEENVITCCVAIFLGLRGFERYVAELRDILGDAKYGNLAALLANIKASHLWVEAHPEISYEDHPMVGSHLLALIQGEPRLEEVFRNHREMLGKDLLPIGSNVRGPESEDQYRELFENATDIIFTHDFDGKLLSINRAVERIAGYTRTEALQMKLSEMVAPEYEPLLRKMIDPQIGGEIPLNSELDFVTKDKSRITLGISTRPIFRGGKAVAVQGIARDITKRRKTEAALQDANQKLEAWVSELEQRTREMTLLNDMGDILRACLTTEEAYSVIVRVAQQIFPVQVGALYVIAPSRNLVEAAALWGDPTLVERSFSPQDCWALRRGRTHWVESSHAGLICRHIHLPPPEGYMCIPMMAQSEALGVLHLMQPDGIRMTDTKQRMAITMSEHIAMALSNLRLHETLRSQSIRDPLTGLFNRRFMEESLELEIRRASRNQRPLGMIMIDLDHFKYFNDNFGHEAGDLLLKELGTLLKGNIRGEDIACRYGGEEFTLILPEGTGAVTRQRAEFFREAIQQLDVHFRGHPLGKITASMGVAVFPDHGRTAKALIEAADKALYRSKADGRDRVTLAG
jgi:diguanylate cyclase (GGDEF)-like protein/PAS domain S-box-containing protein